KVGAGARIVYGMTDHRRRRWPGLILRAGSARPQTDQHARGQQWAPQPACPTHPEGHSAIASLVRKKSAIRIVIEITTTVRVVLFPTAVAPPLVVIPKWQPTSAMIAPNTGVFMSPL